MDQQTPGTPVVKKRRKLWKIILIMLLVLLGLPFAGYFYLRWSGARELAAAIAETDRLDPGWRLADIEASRKVLDPDQNSALLVQRVAALLKGSGLRSNEWGWEELLVDRPASLLNEEQLHTLRPALAKASKALAEARKLQHLPQGRYSLTITPGWALTAMNHCHDVTLVAELLQYDAYVRAHDGDGDGAMESCLALFNAARSFGDEPWGLTMLVRGEVHSRTRATLERILAQSQPSDSSLLALQRALEEELATPLFYRAMRGERAGRSAAAEALAEGKIQYSDLLAGQPPEEAMLLDRVPSLWIAQQGANLRYLNRLVEAAKLPEEEQFARFEQIKSGIKDQPLLVRALAPVFLRVSPAFWRVKPGLRAARSAVAAERYRLQKKEWPATLNALVDAKLLDSVPRDPFAGGPLRYKKMPDGVVIYSVGHDREDNDGTLDNENMTAGSDIGFRLWDVAARRQAPLPPRD